MQKVISQMWKVTIQGKEETVKELVEYSYKAYGEETPTKIAGIICYEAGDVLRDMVRIDDYPNIANVYEKQGQVSLGDVLAMSQLLCAMKGWDFDKIYQDGCERAIERCKEKLQGRDGF